MKKMWLITVSLILAAGLVLIGCPDGSDDTNGSHTGETVKITFDATGGKFPNGEPVFEMEIPKGGKIASPPEAEREGYRFAGWNTDPYGEAGGIALTSAVIHNANATYYAQWEDDAFDFTGTWDNIQTKDDGSYNSWTLQGSIMEAVNEAKAGSLLRLFFDASETTNGENRSGWFIGVIGAGDDSVALWSPNGSGLIYSIDVEVAWLLDVLKNAGSDELTVSAPKSNGDMLTRIALLEPNGEREPPARPGKPAPPNRPDPSGDPLFIDFVEITFGPGSDSSVGKGSVEGAELQKIKDAAARNMPEGQSVVLRVWVRNTTTENRTSWGVGQIIGDGNRHLSGDDPKYQFLFGGGVPPNVDRANDIPIASMIEALGNGNSLELNPYGAHHITMVELWIVKESVVRVQVGQEAKPATVGARSGAVVVVDNGYQLSKTAGHRSGYAWFELDLGTKKLQDYSSVSFTFEAVSGFGDVDNMTGRRIALIASTTALGSASLPTHQTGGSGQAFPLGSSHGYLCAGQVSEPMRDLMDPGLGKPVEVVLKIDHSTYDPGLLNATGKVYFSIYEHTGPTAVIKISNIKFVELAEGECPVCSTGECTCDAAITAAKALVEAATYTATQAQAGTQAAANARVQTIIGGLAMNGVAATVVDGTFTAATAGTAGNPSGANGSYTFTVKLNRGLGTEQITSSKSMTITAAAYSTGDPLDTSYTILHDFENPVNFRARAGSATKAGGVFHYGSSTSARFWPEFCSEHSISGTKSLRLNFSSISNGGFRWGIDAAAGSHIIDLTDVTHIVFYMRATREGPYVVRMMAHDSASEITALTLPALTPADLNVWKKYEIDISAISGLNGKNLGAFYIYTTAWTTGSEGPITFDAVSGVADATSNADAYTTHGVSRDGSQPWQTKYTGVTGHAIWIDALGVRKSSGSSSGDTVFTLAEWLADNPAVTSIASGSRTQTSFTEAPFRMNGTVPAENSCDVVAEGFELFVSGAGQGLHIHLDSRG